MKKKLGELLVASGAVSQAEVDAILNDQQLGDPSRLGDVLLSSGKISAIALAKALSSQNNLPLTELNDVSSAAAALVPLEIQRQHKLVPFRIDEESGVSRVCVAMADPTSRDVIDQLSLELGKPILLYVAAVDEIDRLHDALGGDLVQPALLEDDAPAIDDIFNSLELEVPHSEPLDGDKIAAPRSSPPVKPKLSPPSKPVPAPRASPSLPKKLKTASPVSPAASAASTRPTVAPAASAFSEFDLEGEIVGEAASGNMAKTVELPTLTPTRPTSATSPQAHRPVETPRPTGASSPSNRPVDVARPSSASSPANMPVGFDAPSASTSASSHQAVPAELGDLSVATPASAKRKPSALGKVQLTKVAVSAGAVEIPEWVKKTDAPAVASAGTTTSEWMGGKEKRPEVQLSVVLTSILDKAKAESQTGKLTAALVQVLMRKGLLHEIELLDALEKK